MILSASPSNPLTVIIIFTWKFVFLAWLWTAIMCRMYDFWSWLRVGHVDQKPWRAKKKRACLISKGSDLTMDIHIFVFDIKGFVPRLWRFTTLLQCTTISSLNVLCSDHKETQLILSSFSNRRNLNLKGLNILEKKENFKIYMNNNKIFPLRLWKSYFCPEEKSCFNLISCI